MSGQIILAATMNTTPHQPSGYNSITPSLTIKGCAEALEFYKKAFGATELYRISMPDGSIMHAEMQFGDSRVMMSDEFPRWNCLSPKTIGDTATGLMFFVLDVDATFGQAVAAGATVLEKPTDQFWGDRTGRLLDPFGHRWSLATHKVDVPPEEMARRAAEYMSQGQAAQPAADPYLPPTS